MHSFIFVDFSKFSRILSALILAALTTVTLLLIMHKLVYRPYIEPADETTLPNIDIWMEEARQVTVRIEAPVKPKPPEQPPEPMTQRDIDVPEVASNLPPTSDLFEWKAPKISSAGSGVPVAHLLKQPNYPRRALMRGIEGWVDVRYDISRQGKTVNISVLAAQPEGVFESAALSAVQAWKYQPFVDDNGEPQVYIGLKKRVSFEISD